MAPWIGVTVLHIAGLRPSYITRMHEILRIVLLVVILSRMYSNGAPHGVVLVLIDVIVNGKEEVRSGLSRHEF